MTHLFDADPAGFTMRMWIGMAAAAVIALVGVWLRALTVSGAAAAVIVGASVFASAGLLLSAPLVAFFISGSALNRIGGMRAMQARAVAAKSGIRDARQVFANGGVAAMCALASAACSSHGLLHAARVLLLGAIIAIAAAAGDTWSSEIGVLSPSWPRLITTLAIVRPGVSGAVTLLGTAAAVAGGALVAAAAAPFGIVRPAALVAIGAAAGLAGSVVDSLLGAAVQGAWHCDACNESSESSLHRCGAQARQLRGIRAVGNDTVNALTTAAIAGLGAAIASIAG